MQLLPLLAAICHAMTAPGLKVAVFSEVGLANPDKHEIRDSVACVFKRDVKSDVLHALGTAAAARPIRPPTSQLECAALTLSEHPKARRAALSLMISRTHACTSGSAIEDYQRQ